MFVTVAEQGGVTRAAETLRVAQPSVSAQIRALEAEIGQPLFDRLPRGVRLTDAGQVVLRRARRILGEVAEIDSDIDELSGLRRGRVELGAIPTITSHLIATVVKSFRGLHPGVEITVEEARTSLLLDGVAAHRLDVAVVTSQGQVPQVDLELLFDEELVPILAPDDPLAGRSDVTLAELGERPFLLLETGFGLREIIWNACRNAGFTPRVAQEMESVQAIKALVQIGMGVSLVPSMTVDQEVRLGLLASPRLRGPHLFRRVEVATAHGAYLSRACQAFIGVCRDQARRQTQARQPAGT